MLGINFIVSACFQLEVDGDANKKQAPRAVASRSFGRCTGVCVKSARRWQSAEDWESPPLTMRRSGGDRYWLNVSRFFMIKNKMHFMEDYI